MSELVTDVSRQLAHFDANAVSIAKRQYFQEGDKSIADMFRRVARWVASPEKTDEYQSVYEKLFFELMLNKRFCPGGRVLAGANTSHGNVLNCFVQDGSPKEEGTNAWVMQLATKLALVTKVGGGNGLCLDPISPKHTFKGKCGQLYLTISPSHPDYAKVQTGTYMDLVRGKYVTKGYRFATFVEYEDVSHLPKAKQIGDSVENIWHSAKEMVYELLNGQDVLLDISLLRSEGTPVKGSGGSSSGPSSFAVEVFDNFGYWASLGGAEYAGPVATLRYIFAPTLRVIRQGGTRRGAGMATMSITNPNVADFITCKDLDREQAEGDISTFNISVLVSDEFMETSRNKADGILYDIAEHAHSTGEPGVIFIDRINEHNAMLDTLGAIKSTNPCVTADTWIMTHLGARQVKGLINIPFCVPVDGQGYRSEGFWSTGTKPVYRLKTKQGFELCLTGNHKLKKVTKYTRYKQDTTWVEVSNLNKGDFISLSNHREGLYWGGVGCFEEGWLLGCLIGDGTFASEKNKSDRAHLDFWGQQAESMAGLALERIRKFCVARSDLKVKSQFQEGKFRVGGTGLANLAARFDVYHGNKVVTDKIEEASKDFYLGFLRGFFDADGSVQGTQAKGISVRLAQSNLNTLKRVQRMLARLGIISNLYENRREAGYRSLPDGHGGHKDYYTKAQHELIIAKDNLPIFAELINFEDKVKKERLTDSLASYKRTLNRERFIDEIVSIDLEGKKEVFDATVDLVHEFDANGISAHNCGEIPLYAGEPCDLGAMNLAAYVKNKEFDFDSFNKDVKVAIRFLDNVLEVNNFALEDNREMSMRLRRLGLGVMGLADALIKMGQRYDSEQGRKLVTDMITALRDSAHEASKELAEERSLFPDFEKSDLKEKRRNVAVLTTAPTGTTSMVMGVSSGIEPVFAPFIYRKVGSDYMPMIAPLFEELLELHEPHPSYELEGKWHWDKVVKAIQDNHGSVQNLDFVPKVVKDVFLCAHDVNPEDHVRMQGVVQRAFDDDGNKLSNSISKTINMPNEATVGDVYSAYSLAFKEKCKGITVYRDGSRDLQVLNTSTDTKSPDKTENKKGSVSQEERLPSEPLFDRPMRLTGFTDAVKLTLPNGDKRGFYVTVNKQDDLPTEVFIISGKAGDEANADAEALGRLASMALQYGVPAEAIIKTLRGINGGMYGTYQGRMVASKADLIAVALETTGAENVLNKMLNCPDCGGTLRFEEGCQKCGRCGYSKCG